MANGLNPSDVVNVTIDLSPIAAAKRNFGTLCIAGDSDVLDPGERMRWYTGLDGVAEDYGVSAPEYVAAAKYFSQVPRPNELYTARWVRDSIAGRLHGAVLAPSGRVMSNFNPITAGAMYVAIDGVPHAVTGVNMGAATNLNGVASRLQTALAAASPGTTVVWDADIARFNIKSGTVGVGSTVSYATAPRGIGSFIFAGQPAANNTIVVNGTTVTFVTTGAAGNQVNIGGTLDETLANAATFLNGSADVNIAKSTYMVAGSVLYAVSKVVGAPGNAYTLAFTGANITVSGATFAGGTGVDLATPMGLTQASGASVPVDGMAPESWPQCVAKLADISNDWYGLQNASSVEPTIQEHLDAAAFIEGSTYDRIYGITTNDPRVLDPTDNTDICSSVRDSKFMRTFTQFSNSPFATSSIFGRAFTVNFEASNSTITLKFKQEPGVVPERITESQAKTLQGKNCNVFVNYNNGTAMIQEGKMANGFFFDEVHGLDWLKNAIQTDVFNLLYQSETKIPQTDAGVHQIVVEVENTCDRAVNNGLAAPGQWRGPEIGPARGPVVKYLDTLTKGYQVYAPMIASQPQSDREARRSPPIQVALKLAGAIHFADVLVQVNR